MTVPPCFAARPCIVGEWSPWSGCSDQCRPAARVRRRLVQQEALNGGAPCPALEERAGCLEYSTRRGQDCGRAFGNVLRGFHRWAGKVPAPQRVGWAGRVCREQI